MIEFKRDSKAIASKKSNLTIRVNYSRLINSFKIFAIFIYECFLRIKLK